MFEKLKKRTTREQLVDVLSELKSSIVELDREVNVQAPQVTVQPANVEIDLATLEEKISDLQSAIEALELHVDAPVVNVDTKEVVDRLVELQEAVKSLDLHVEAPNVDVKSVVDVGGIEKAVRDIEIAIENNKALDAQSLRNILKDSLATLFSNDPKKYLPVRLTNGKDFYNAIAGLTASLGNVATSDNQTGGSQKTQIVDQNGDVAQVTSDGEVYVVSKCDVSAGNSSTVPLGANATFTGTAVELLEYVSVTVNVKASHASATDGLVIEFSPDGTNWDNNDRYTIPADIGKTFTSQRSGRYLRIRYTNGSTQQTYFRLETILNHVMVKPSSHRVQDTISDDDDGELNLSVLKLRTAQNNYISGSATNSGNFKVSLEEYNGSVRTDGLPVSLKDNASIDAFGRLRSSQTSQRFDVEYIYDKQLLIIDEVLSGGATATHNVGTRDISIAVNNTTTDTSGALYSHYDVPYTAGNSQLIDITGVLNLANIAGGTAELFVRTSTSGSVAETTYPQAEWDSNATGVNWQFAHILMMDFQSLKVGRIRFFLVKGGIPNLLKEVHNDNVRNSGYWQTPTLPLYWRIYNDATFTYMEMGYGDTANGIGLRYKVAKNASATMKAICGTVKNEGGLNLLEMSGYPFSISNRITPITVSTTLVPVLSIRVASLFKTLTNRGLAIPLGYSIQTDNPINYRILYRPTLTNASFVAVDTESFMEYDVSATAITGGVLIEDDYVSTSRNIPIGNTSLLGRTILSQGRTGTSDILTVCAVRTSTTNASVFASLKWKEIR